MYSTTPFFWISQMLLGFCCFGINSQHASAFDGKTEVSIAWIQNFSFSTNIRFAVSPDSEGVAVFDVPGEKLIYLSARNGQELRTWDVPLGTEFLPEIFFVSEDVIVLHDMRNAKLTIYDTTTGRIGSTVSTLPGTSHVRTDNLRPQKASQDFRMRFISNKLPLRVWEVSYPLGETKLIFNLNEHPEVTKSLSEWESSTQYLDSLIEADSLLLGFGGFTHCFQLNSESANWRWSERLSEAKPVRFVGIDAKGLIASVRGACVRLRIGDGQVATSLQNVDGRPLLAKNDCILVLEDPVVRMPAQLSVWQWSSMKKRQTVKLSDNMVLPQHCVVANDGCLLFFLDGTGRFGAVDLTSFLMSSP